VLRAYCLRARRVGGGCRVQQADDKDHGDVRPQEVREDDEVLQPRQGLQEEQQVRILLDEDLQLDQLDQYLQRAGVLTLPIIKLQKCKDIRITQKNNSDNNDHLQNNRNLKVAKIIHHLSTSSTHKIPEISLLYQHKTNQK